MGDDLKLKYEVNLTKTGDGAQAAAKDLQAVGVAGEKSAQSLEKLGTQAKQAIAALAASALIRHAVAEFATYEATVARLNGTLRASGQFSSAYSSELRDMADALAKVTRFGDGAVLDAQAQLVAFGALREEMPKLTEMVLNLAEGGKGLGESVTLVGAAMNGNFTPAAKFLQLNLDETASRAENFERVMRALEERSRGVAREVGASAGNQFVQLKSAFGDVEKEAGRLFTTLSGPAVRTLTTGFRHMAEELKTNQALMIAVRDAAVGMGIATAAAVTAGGLAKAGGTAVGLFGPGAAMVTRAADVAAMAALLGEKFAPALKAAGLAGAALTAGLTAYEGLKFGDALKDEAGATQQAAEMHARLRDRIGEEITAREALNQLTAEQAAQMRSLVRPGADSRDLRAVTNQLFPSGAPAGQDTRRTEDLVSSQRGLLELARKLELESARNFGAGVFTGGEAGFKTSSQLLDQGFELRLQELETQTQKGLITEATYFDKRKELEHQFQMGRAQLGRAGEEAQREFDQSRMDRFAVEQERVRLHYRDLEETVSAYYDYLWEKRKQAGGEGMAGDLEMITGQKQDAMGEMILKAKQAQYEASFLGSTLVNIGTTGAQSFANGMSNAFVQFASGAKSASQAFSQFASSFMQQIAQMIMQALILRAVQGIFGAMAPAGNAQGGWGALSTGVRQAAEGGIIPRKMAMGGFQTVNSATYFPRFNAVAGEAGAEVLAVLSRPRFMEIGGLASYVGSVQGQRVAMTNADDLARSAGARGASGGHMVIEVRGTRDFEARVIDSSIEGAVVRVVNDLHTDTPMSSAVKGLTS